MQSVSTRLEQILKTTALSYTTCPEGQSDQSYLPLVTQDLVVMTQPSTSLTQNWVGSGLVIKQAAPQLFVYKEQLIQHCLSK